MQSANKSEPLVVIEMITYNHENYIAQAIESVVKQKTTFNFKLIICEDGSLDNTAKICTAYKKKYPEKIDLYLNEKNIGVRLNAKKLHELSFGSNAKYIAMLDGDDYWIDENKLQKQVDFLEANPDYTICFHRVYEKLDTGKLRKGRLNTETTERSYTIDDLAVNNFIQTPSVVFRRVFEQLPEEVMSFPILDYVIHLLNASKGKIKYLPDLMAVYRIHNQGTFSMVDLKTRSKAVVRNIMLLMTLDLPTTVLESLRLQYLKVQEEYLIYLLTIEEFDTFAVEAKDFFNEHPERAIVWIYSRIPDFFKNLQTSKTYQLSKKLAKTARKLKLIS